MTPSDAITPARYSGSRWPSGSAMTSLAPTVGANSSHTDTSKVVGVFCKMTSFDPIS